MKNFHLIISALIVIPAAIFYGFFPNVLLDIYPKTADEHNFQKAVMGLYLAFASLWIIGIFKPEFWKTATITNICFMLGLVFGRLLSQFHDGTPSIPFILGILGEFVLGLYAWWILKKKQTK